MSLLNKALKWSFVLLIVSLPFQLNSFVYQMDWGRGFLNPYTSIFFSLTELLLLISGLLFLIVSRLHSKKIQTGDPVLFTILLLALLLLSLSLLHSSNGLYSFFILAKILGLFLFYVLLVNKILPTEQILRIFAWTLSFQALLALFQVLFQTDLGLTVLGEPHLSEGTAHRALLDIFSYSIVRGVGTFPHPNVLGGFLAIGIFSTFLIKARFRGEKSLLFGILFSGLFLTFSRSALLGFLLGLLFLFLLAVPSIKLFSRRKLLIFLSLLLLSSLVLFSRGISFFEDPSWLQRWEDVGLAWKLFWTHPFGVGFTQFTLFLDSLSEEALMPWEYQPVHNVFLLVLDELGIVGFLFIFPALAFLFHQLYSTRQWVYFSIFIVLVFIGLFDHYLFSLEQGRLLVLLFFALSSIKLSSIKM